jgi:DNA primase
MAYIDFDALKKHVTIEEAVKLLGLSMKLGNSQFRGPCPSCKSGGDRALVVTPAKSAFYCFAAQKGGDAISLAAHVRGEGVRDAATWLAQRSGLVQVNRTVPSNSSQSFQEATVPESDSGKQGDRTLAPLSYLECDHPAVDAVGFDAEIAKQLGIGYAGKGIMRGTVAIPIRDEHGVLKGYVGVTEARLPPSFMGKNVIEFGKKSA